MILTLIRLLFLFIILFLWITQKKKSVLIATTDILHDKKLTFFMLIPNFDKKCLF